MNSIVFCSPHSYFCFVLPYCFLISCNFYFMPLLVSWFVDLYLLFGVFVNPHSNLDDFSVFSAHLLWKPYHSLVIYMSIAFLMVSHTDLTVAYYTHYHIIYILYWVTHPLIWYYIHVFILNDPGWYCGFLLL